VVPKDDRPRRLVSTEDALGRLPSTAELDAWVLETAPRAVAYAASLLRDRHRAEDVVQDCYCRLLAKAGAYDLLRDGQKLLFRSITNACINATTRGRRTLSLQALGQGSDGGAWEWIDDSAASPDERMVHSELEAAVGEALAKVPVQHRAALELKSLGHSQQEIAEMLGVTASNAGVLVHRARQMMAELLKPMLGESP
jgi:RNA polymerase sigma-70 factor, ECF subfamily